MRVITAATFILALTSPLFGQHQHQHQPYAGMNTRAVKALSEQQISDLKAGRGMGLALAAELNGYPGPSHVIELGNQLNLSDAQRAKMQALFEAMRTEAIQIGEKLIAEESAQDISCAGKTITEESLVTSTRAIGALNAELRAAHLKYHLLTAAELTDRQMKQYASLRGYGGGGAPHLPRH